MQPSEELPGKEFQLWCALNDAIEERDRYKAAMEKILERGLNYATQSTLDLLKATLDGSRYRQSQKDPCCKEDCGGMGSCGCFCHEGL